MGPGEGDRCNFYQLISSSNPTALFSVKMGQSGLEQIPPPYLTPRKPMSFCSFPALQALAVGQCRDQLCDLLLEETWPCSVGETNCIDLTPFFQCKDLHEHFVYNPICFPLDLSCWAHYNYLPNPPRLYLKWSQH